MRLRYKLLIILAIISVSSYFLVYYINHTLIPVKLKDALINALRRQTQREAEIEDLSFSLSRGFVVKGVRLYEGPRKSDEVLFEAEKASFGVIFVPSFKGWLFIIPRLGIEEPYLKLERSADGIWNTSSLFTKKEGVKKPRFQVIVKSISFNDGSLDFGDYYQNRSFKKQLTSLKGSAWIAVSGAVSLRSSGKIIDAPLKISLKFNPDKKYLSLALDTQGLPFADYLNNYLPSPPEQAENAQPLKVKVDSGICDLSLNMDIVNFEDIKAKGNIHIKDLAAGLNGIKATGNYKLSGTANLNRADPAVLRYGLRLELDNANISTPVKNIGNIGSIKGVISLSENEWVAKGLSASIYGSPVLITGRLSRPHKDFVAEIEASSVLSLVKIADLVGMDIDKGKADIKTRITYKKDKTYNIGGEAKVAGIRLCQKGVIISGDFIIDAAAGGNAGDPDSLIYKGDVGFDRTRIEGLGFLPFISDASGEATFSNRGLTIKRLSGTAADTKISLSGDIDYAAKEASVKLNLKTDMLSIPKFLSSLPQDASQRFKDIGIEGFCWVDMAFAGVLGRPDTFTYDGRLSVKNGSVTLPYWPNRLTEIRCDMQFKKQDITWEGLYFNFKGVQYQSSGRVINLGAPQVSASLKSKDTDMTAEFNIKENVAEAIKLSGRYRNSDFLIQGSMPDLKNAYADISGNARLELSDMPYIFSPQAERLLKLKPAGMVRLNFTLQGPLREPAEWAFFAEGNSEAVYIWGLKLNDFYIDYRMKDRFIDVPTLVAYPYGGIINISSRANLKREGEQPYIVNIDIKDVDLHSLVADTEFKNKKISGTFALQSVLNGYLNQKDSLKGRGWLQVSDGYLWEFPVVHGMLNVIFMIPPEYITLTDAFGNFTVENDRIYTEDFKILSKTASLLWAGSLGLDGTLDFGITGRFAEDVVKQTTEPGRIAGAILREAGNLIMEVRLTGTLAKPKYQIVPFPVDKILKEKVFDRVKDIFGNILE